MLTQFAIDFINSYWEDIPSWVFDCEEEYCDGWADYEDCYYLLIFSKENQFYFVEHATCAACGETSSSKDKFEYCVQKITFEESIEKIEEVEEVSNKIACW